MINKPQQSNPSLIRSHGDLKNTVDEINRSLRQTWSKFGDTERKANRVDSLYNAEVSIQRILNYLNTTKTFVGQVGSNALSDGYIPFFSAGISGLTNSSMKYSGGIFQATQPLEINNTTASTSYSTGAIKTTGGIGCRSLSSKSLETGGLVKSEAATGLFQQAVAGSDYIDGSGTTNRLVKFTESKSLGDSTITDNGTTISTSSNINAGIISGTAGGFGNSSNNTKFDSTGHMTMVGNARPWRDALGELITKKTTGVRVTDDAVEGVTNFSDSCLIADDYKSTNLQLNHDRDNTAPIYPHIHWFQASANIPNWLIQYRWQVNGGIKVTSWTNYKMNTPVFSYVSGTIHQICYGSSITPPANSNLSDVLQVKVCRDTNNSSTLFSGSDPLTGNAAALSFDVHLQINSVGSDNEYTK